jgi:predicted nucleic acid-binding protein
LTEIGLKAKDALHIAGAIEGKANYFLTTDGEILKKCSTYNLATPNGKEIFGRIKV